MMSKMDEIDIKALKHNIKNILIIRRNNIGDMICAIPALRAIRRELPLAHITVLAGYLNSGIIDGSSFVDEVIVYKKGRGIYSNKYIGYWKLLRRRKERFDLAIALKIGFSSTMSLITLISGARLRMGCTPEKWHPLQNCYNLPVNGYKKWKSMLQVDALLEFIKVIGIENSAKDIRIETKPDVRNRVKRFFTEKNIRDGGNIIVFNISNNKSENIWSAERFKETSDMLAKQYKATFIVTSTPSDKDKAARLVKDMNVNAVYCETPDVMDFAAIAEAAGLLICGEGGAMHVGSSVGTPTISLWGKNRAVKWTPFGEKQIVVKRGEHVDSILPGDILEAVRKNNLLKKQ